MKRTGFDSDVAYAAGQDISMIWLETDVSVDVVSNGERARLQNNTLPQGWVNWNYRITA